MLKLNPIAFSIKAHRVEFEDVSYELNASDAVLWHGSDTTDKEAANGFDLSHTDDYGTPGIRDARTPGLRDAPRTRFPHEQFLKKPKKTVE